MNIVLPDGSVKELEEGATVADVAASIGAGLARAALAAFLVQLDPTVPQLADMKTAVSEAVTNAIIHGYQGEVHTITIEGELEGDLLTLRVRDAGVGIADIGQAMEPLYTSRPELERSGISTRVVKLNRIAPLDTAAILRETEGAETVLILEDCFENGSVGQQLAAAMEEAGQCCPHMILQNLKDHFAPEGTVDQLRHRFGLDADGVVKTVKEAMSCEQ